MTSATAADTLARAIERITPIDNWCRKAFARDAAGRVVNTYAESATQWCAAGAISYECPKGVQHAVMSAIYEELADSPYDDLAMHNDHATHAKTLALLHRALQRLIAQDAQ